jgi:hypothetical protein
MVLSEVTCLFEQDSLFLRWVSSAVQEQEKPVNLTLHEEDFGVRVEWYLFATSHGKNACDALGWLFG